jgi:hypothetical protein
MNIDAAQFRRIVAAVLGPREPGYRDATTAPLLPEDAERVISIVQLAEGAGPGAGGDGAVLAAVTGHLSRLVDHAVRPAGIFAGDDADRLDRMRAHAAALAGQPAAALAYALAYLVAISDFELAPAETAFLDELRVALGIDADTGDEVLATISEIVTPEA